ncbi:hypothetical protein G7Z17_g9275 [Cylindrodendrum hubeiense]|uniref:ORC1/DEAH AAA+ ATPase domain-containing protein n=1 Tax=Cylindrodendrum hubeiense TaxID=595255 RepID=A0A9P5L5V0_9HYPO|nr:hypothetical protein G7Z17_g9275 [Cylindrodendrum hubeiense]
MMDHPASSRRKVSDNRFRDNTTINQGNVHYHLPHQPARAVVRVIPYPRNEDVINRPDIVTKLNDLLSATPKYCSAALWGLGGTGKTQIALDYAYQQCDNSDCSVFWVHADSEATFSHDYKSIAKELGIHESLKNEDLLAAVRDGIKALPRWVLILDNADDLTIFGVEQGDGQAKNLDEYIPRGSTGTVLWTSRDGRIRGSLVGSRRGIQVSFMATEEAKQLLAIARDQKTGGQKAETTALIKELQSLPLAISQAGAYMRRTETSVKEYLILLKQVKMRWDILRETECDRHRRNDVPNSILETWSISINHIRQTSEMAYNILHVMAYVNNEDISHEMIAAAVSYADDKHAEQPEEIEVARAITRLKEFSFLTESQAFFMIEGAGGRENLWMSRRWNFDKKCLGRSIRIRSAEALGEKHPNTISSKAGLAATYYAQGRYDEAEPIEEEVLKLRREVLGKKHPDTIKSMVALAITYHEQGRYNKAERMKAEALKLQRELRGEKHPDTIWCMSELATTYYAQGWYDKAETIDIKVLKLRREVLGKKHPDTINSMAALATTYHEQGRYDKAERMQVEALKLLQEVLGKKHPYTLEAMHELAITWNKCGRRNEALSLLQKCLQWKHLALGQDHPSTKASSKYLVEWKQSRGGGFRLILKTAFGLRR